MPSEHSDTVGGSSAARVIACPGSVAQCRMAPPQTTSEHSAAGTTLHDCTEALLDESRDENHPDDFLNRTVKGVKVTQGMIDTKLFPALTWFEETLDPDEFILEAKCQFPGIQGAFGTADVVYRKGNEYGVVDWKFGDGVPVAIESNAQIMFYLWAAFNSFPDFFPNDLAAFRGHIYQPFTDASKEKHKHATFTRQELTEFATMLEEAVYIAAGNQAPLAIGDHCKWCAAKPFCPKIRDVAAGIMDREGERTPEEMLADLEMADSLEQLVKELRKSCADYVRRGNELEGWKLVDSLGNRFFVGDPEPELRRRGLRVMDIYPKKVDTPAGIERAIERRKLKIDITDLTDRKVTGDKLVPADSKTPEKLNVMAKLKQISHVIKAKNLRG